MYIIISSYENNRTFTQVPTPINMRVSESRYEQIYIYIHM